MDLTVKDHKCNNQLFEETRNSIENGYFTEKGVK